MRKPNKEIQLASYDDLLGIEDNEDKVIQAPLNEIYDFNGHPFYVRDDEEMEVLADSVGELGVLNPGITRPRKGGGYELIAGHRRKRACERKKINTMPIIVRNYSDDEATIIMVDSNIQRENIRPSEKAFAYKMKLEAIRHQGVKNDNGEEAATLVGKKAGDSARKVQRYIRLTELLPELLEMVDSGKIKVSPAVILSFLTEQEQQWVLNCIREHGANVNGNAADKLKAHSEDCKLNEALVLLILCEKKAAPAKVTLPEKRIRSYFSEDYTKEQIEEIIYTLLEQWKQKEGEEG
ncbi:MAG: ParB/RepB/Spo0J family partition protein [Lachnospiraceae bacterium]|nr:ParB/RepB/Spo0J family partition protein [Lachnospiraceae bacterium]